MAAEAGTHAGTVKPRLARSGTSVFRRLRGRAVLRIGWGLADQAVSSLTNFMVSIYVVHMLGAVQFGAFTLAYVTYGFALNASRGLATDPLMIRFSSTSLRRWRRAVASCTGTATAIGLAAGLCVVVVGMFLGGRAGAAFLALGLTLPGLLLQDSWRYAFFALGRGGRAFLNDLIWAIVLLGALLFMRASGHVSVFWFVLAWGGAAAVAAAVGLFQAGVIPKLLRAWTWLSQHRDLGPRYFAVGVSSSLSTQARAYGISLMLGLAAVGYVQAATTLMGPITILFLGMSMVILPEAARVLHRSPRRLTLFCVLVSGGLAAAALTWGVVLMVAVPRGVGGWLLGPIWRPAYPLLVPAILVVIGLGTSAGASAGLRALGAAQRSLHVAIVVSVTSVASALIGAAEGGALGTIWGSVFSAWLGAVLLWWQLRVAMRQHGTMRAGYRMWSSRPNGRHRRQVGA